MAFISRRLRRFSQIKELKLSIYLRSSAQSAENIALAIVDFAKQNNRRVCLFPKAGLFLRICPIFLQMTFSL